MTVLVVAFAVPFALAIDAALDVLLDPRSVSRLKRAAAAGLRAARAPETRSIPEHEAEAFRRFARACRLSAITCKHGMSVAEFDAAIARAKRRGLPTPPIFDAEAIDAWIRDSQGR